jgi:hypothetical protein
MSALSQPAVRAVRRRPLVAAAMRECVCVCVRCIAPIAIPHMHPSTRSTLSHGIVRHVMVAMADGKAEETQAARLKSDRRSNRSGRLAGGYGVGAGCGSACLVHVHACARECVRALAARFVRECACGCSTDLAGCCIRRLADRPVPPAHRCCLRMAALRLGRQAHRHSRHTTVGQGCTASTHMPACDPTAASGGRGERGSPMVQPD